MCKKYLIPIIIFVFILIVIIFLLYSRKKEHIVGMPKLTLYYTDWCGHSKAFMNTWQKLKDNGNATFVQYECDQEPNMCKNVPIGANGNVIDIDGYPTLILTRPDGINVHYNGNRDINDIENFIIQNSNL